MVALIWDAVGEKVYEGGVDRGVLYIRRLGTAWNGLIEVSHGNNDDVSPVYIDGLKIRDVVSVGDFSASMRAYTYPNEFLPCDGFLQYEGMYLADQPLQEFSLAYRTRVGNDVEGPETHYKIHILYNLTAVADDIDYSTLSDSVQPVEFGWAISARPEVVPGYKPTAHFVIDSRLWDPAYLASFEEVLYGTAMSPPMLPSGENMFDILDLSTTLVIIDNGAPEWTAVDLGNKHLSFYPPEIFQIDSPSVVMIDEFTFDVSSYPA